MSQGNAGWKGGAPASSIQPLAAKHALAVQYMKARRGRSSLEADVSDGDEKKLKATRHIVSLYNLCTHNGTTPPQPLWAAFFKWYRVCKSQESTVNTMCRDVVRSILDDHKQLATMHIAGTAVHVSLEDVGIAGDWLPFHSAWPSHIDYGTSLHIFITL